jgi:hypothetical protein
MHDLAFALVPAGAAARSSCKWFVPKPNSPIAPAWTAVLRETSGWRSGTVGFIATSRQNSLTQTPIIVCG